MKAQKYQIDALAGEIKNTFQGALVFGYDESMVQEYAKKIAHFIVPNLKDDFAVREITAAQIKENASLVLDELNALSLMGGRRVVWIKNATESMGSMIDDVLQNLKTNNFLLITGDAFSKSASVRVVCENHPKILTIVCYPDEANDIRLLIQNTLSQNGYQITSDAVAAFMDSVGQSRGMTLSELDKLMTYQKNDKLITAETIHQVIDNSSIFSFDSLCFAIGEGNHANANTFYNKLLESGETPVSIIRKLLTYFNKLLLGVHLLSQKKSMEEALKKVLTPAQFKLKSAVSKQLTYWNKEALSQILKQLLETEKSTKTTALPAELIVLRTITSLTARAQKLQHR